MCRRPAYPRSLLPPPPPPPLLPPLPRERRPAAGPRRHSAPQTDGKCLCCRSASRALGRLLVCVFKYNWATTYPTFVAGRQAVHRGDPQRQDCLDLRGPVHRLRHLRQGAPCCSPRARLVGAVGWTCSSGSLSEARLPSALCCCSPPLAAACRRCSCAIAPPLLLLLLPAFAGAAGCCCRWLPLPAAAGSAAAAAQTHACVPPLLLPAEAPLRCHPSTTCLRAPHSQCSLACLPFGSLSVPAEVPL